MDCLSSPLAYQVTGNSFNKYESLGWVSALNAGDMIQVIALVQAQNMSEEK